MAIVTKYEIFLQMTKTFTFKLELSKKKKVFANDNVDIRYALIMQIILIAKHKNTLFFV